LGETGSLQEAINAHRLTLQGDQVKASVENYGSIQRRLRAEQPSERHSEIKDIQMSSTQLDSVRQSQASIRSGAHNLKTLEIISHYNPPPQISILEVDNLFSPTA
jgi:hypothetical protein